MRYSEIIGIAFYRIGLTKEQYALVDAYALASAHHRIRALQADDLRNGQFHQRLYWKHLKALFKIVRSGNFSRAIDLSKRGMDHPDSWNPDKLPELVSILTDLDKTALPHENMFVQMLADRRFEIGDNHPYDELLETSGLKLADFNLSQDQAIAS